MVVGVKKVEIMIMITYYDYDDLISIMLILMLTLIWNEMCHKITSKEEDRSLSADYEDLDAYEEDFEDTNYRDTLTEYDRNFWDGMMGTEEDKRTQVWLVCKDLLLQNIVPSHFCGLFAVLWNHGVEHKKSERDECEVQVHLWIYWGGRLLQLGMPLILVIKGALKNSSMKMGSE